MRRSVAILDGDTQQRAQLITMLKPVYRVQAYSDPLAAQSGMQLDWPDLIVVGQRIGDLSGIGMARDLNRNRRFATVPFLFITDTEDSRLRDQLLLVGVKALLVKPFDVRTLLSAVEGLLNAETEKGWQELPQAQRKALESTIAAFNGVVRDLAAGNAPAMGPITEACSLLVDVVARDELGPLLDKIKNHDNFTFVHSLRFSAFMTLFARAIGLPREMQIQVASGGLLQDIGMVAIPPWILQKQEPLTPSEWKMVRNHVSTGLKLLQAMGAVGKGIEIIVGQHHERLDGSGYPRGLKGAELNELARMAGIIDVFCGLTDRRPYKDPLSAHAALELMATSLSRQLDGDLLQKFRDILLDTVSAASDVAAVS